MSPYLGGDFSIANNEIVDMTYGNLAIAEVCVGNERIWPKDGGIIVSPKVVSFEAVGGTQAITVENKNTYNPNYIVDNLPSWLHVTGQITTGFTLICDSTSLEIDETVTIYVRSVTNPSIYDTIEVTRWGAFTTEIIYQIQTTVPNETPPVGIKLSSSEINSLARIQWDTGFPWVQVVVTQGTPGYFVAPNGQTIELIMPNNIPVTYANPGLHTVTVRTRVAVDGIRLANEEPGDWTSQGISNPYVKKIIKVKSDTQTLHMAFAGLTHATVDPTFQLETPNVIDLTKAFQHFASDLKPRIDGGANIWDRQEGRLDMNSINTFRFPAHMLDQCTKVTALTRTFYNSGIEAINVGFFDKLVNLVAVFETFRNTLNLGYNWFTKYGDPTTSSIIEAPEYIPTSLFWNCTKLEDFTGCFNWIGGGDWPGVSPYWGGPEPNPHATNYSGYAFNTLVRRDFFKNTKAKTVTFMFNKWTRGALEKDVFGLVKGTLENINCVFYGWAQPHTHWAWWAPIGGVEGATSIDLDEIFPGGVGSWPNIKSAIGAFMDNVDHPTTYRGFNWFDIAYGPATFDAVNFLNKFTGATTTSGIDDFGAKAYFGISPTDPIDGMASVFSNMNLRVTPGSWAAAASARPLTVVLNYFN